MKYRAAVLDQPGNISVQEYELKFPAVGEALLRIIASGVCGTDLAIHSGEYKVPLPVVLGHEFVAIVELAPGAPKLVGQRVVCEINNTCTARGLGDLCPACAKGMPNHCQSRSVTGIVEHDGSFAEYVVVPQGALHVLPEEIDVEQAVMIEPLAAAIRTFELTPIKPGDAVAILGCGRLGRLVALVAKKKGARVLAIGRSARNMRLMAPYSEAVVANDCDAARLREWVLDQTQGLGANVVVEATGDNSKLALALELVRPRGTVALKSTSGVPVEQLDTTAIAVNEICLQGSRCGPFDKAIEFITEHGQPDSSWITKRFPLNYIADAMAAARTEPKVIVDCGKP